MSHDRGRRQRHRVRGASGVVAGRRAATEAVRAGRATELLVAPSSKVTQGMRELLEAAEVAGVSITETPRARLDSLAPGHQGVVARLRPPGGAEATIRGTGSGLSEGNLTQFPFGDDAVVVVLDGITDPQNLGAAARSAEAAGAAVLVTRTKRAADATPAAVRASAGALLHLPHARVVNIARTLARLKDTGFWVIGLDGDATTTVYDDACPSGRVAIVVGSEGEGMSRLVRERCDLLVRLPMAGRVGSLNASASLAAVLYSYVLPSRMPATADPSQE